MTKTLIVRSGGGMPGLDIHAGIGLALRNAGITATHCIGTSAGAIISALDASGMSYPEIAKQIITLRDSDVRSPRPLWRMRPWIDYIFQPTKIMRLLENLLPYGFSSLSKPLGVHCTRNRDGRGVTFGTVSMDDTLMSWFPPLRQAVLASMSIHGFFPEVRIDRHDYSDGGTTANVPIPLDLTRYDRVIVCIATPPTEYPVRNRLIPRLVANIQWLMRGQIDSACARVFNNPKVTIIWPNVGKSAGTMRFRHSLIVEAEREASKQLASPTSFHRSNP